jgi:chemotaxis signal transduction protein
VSDEQMIVFEVAGQAYSLPIRDVVEVAEVGPLACVPTLPPDVGGVLNHHGDALPVLHPQVLFEGARESGRRSHLIVVGDGEADAGGRLGIQVDRIFGLALGQRSWNGRVVSILDTRRLLERATAAIESSNPRGDET